jgi:hypothetical protein
MDERIDDPKQGELSEKELLQNVLENALVELNRSLQTVSELNKQIDESRTDKQ